MNLPPEQIFLEYWSIKLWSDIHPPPPPPHHLKPTIKNKNTHQKKEKKKKAQPCSETMHGHACTHVSLITHTHTHTHIHTHTHTHTHKQQQQQQLYKKKTNKKKWTTTTIKPAIFTWFSGWVWDGQQQRWPDPEAGHATRPDSGGRVIPPAAGRFWPAQSRPLLWSCQEEAHWRLPRWEDLHISDAVTWWLCVCVCVHACVFAWVHVCVCVCVRVCA